MTTDKARAEAREIVLGWFNPMSYGERPYIRSLPGLEDAIAAALTARDAEAAAKLARVEAALAKWLREAVKVLAEEGVNKRSVCSGDSEAVAQTIAKAALDAAGGAQ